MTRTFLLVESENDLPLSPEEVSRWRERVERKYGAPQKPLTEIATRPFRADLELERSPDPDEVDDLIKVIAEAFQGVGVAAGTFEVSASEHPNDDVDFEAPPYLEATIELPLPDPSTYCTVSIQMRSPVDLPESLPGLEQQLRAHLSMPISSVGRMKGGRSNDFIPERHVMVWLKRVPRGDLLSPREIFARIQRAAQAAGIEIERVNVAACVGDYDWDKMIFKEEISQSK